MPRNPNPNQARRIRPQGSDRVICVVTKKADGRAVVEAAGRATRKYSAKAQARQNALRALKKALGRHFVMGEYALTYRNA